MTKRSDGVSERVAGAHALAEAAQRLFAALVALTDRRNGQAVSAVRTEIERKTPKPRAVA